MALRSDSLLSPKALPAASRDVPAAADRPTPPAALVQMAAGVVLLGASWPLTRLAVLDGAGPAWFAISRAGLSAVVATAALLALRRLRLPRRADLPSLFAVGLLQLAGFFAFAHAAVAIIPAGRTAVLANCTIIFTVPLSTLVLREPISARRWLAAGLSAAGVLVLIGPWSVDWSRRAPVLGHAYLLGAALCWALAMLAIRRWPPRSSMLELLPWAFGLATAALLPMALEGTVGHWGGTAILCMLGIGLLVAPTGTWCIMQATALLPIVVTSVGFLAGPAIGVVLATLFLHERLGPDLLLGTVLVLVGAALAAVPGRAR